MTSPAVTCAVLIHASRSPIEWSLDRVRSAPRASHEDDGREERTEHDHGDAEHEHRWPTRVVSVQAHGHELGDRRAGRAQQHRRHCTMRAGGQKMAETVAAPARSTAPAARRLVAVLLVGGAVSVALGVYGKAHDPTHEQPYSWFFTSTI